MSAPTPDPELLTNLLPEIHTWSDRAQPNDLEPLPTGPTVLLFIDRDRRPVQLLTTQQTRRLATARLTTPPEQHPTKADLAAVVRGVRWRNVTGPFPARWRYYQLASALHPREYRQLVAFGPAWFLHQPADLPVPDITITNRIWESAGPTLGPWPARTSAQQALDGLRDLFDLCRHPEQVRRAPAGQRCAYAEMGRCDAPCDGSTPINVYADRVASAWQFARGAVQPWIDNATERMRTAAADQQFELAGQIKQQLAFARTWQTNWQSHIRPAEQLDYLLALPVTRRRSRQLFLFRRGELLEGPTIKPRKCTDETLTWLNSQPPPQLDTIPPIQRREQTWLLAHLLFHREADRALIIPIHPETDENSLRSTIETRLAALNQADSHPAPDQSGNPPAE